MVSIRHMITALGLCATSAIAAVATIPVVYPYGDTLLGGQSLLKNQGLISDSGQYILVVQGDNNLVIYYQKSNAVFATLTNNYNIDHATLGTDGTFAVYDTGDVARWTSNSARTDGGHFRMVLGDDGILTISETIQTKRIGHGLS